MKRIKGNKKGGGIKEIMRKVRKKGRKKGRQEERKEGKQEKRQEGRYQKKCCIDTDNNYFVPQNNFEFLKYMIDKFKLPLRKKKTLILFYNNKVRFCLYFC